MPNIIDILARALSLRQETALNSITPNRAGGIMYDTLLVLNQMQLEGGSLLISKVYASVSAMEADTTPTSDLTGRALKPGQLVVIVTSDSSSSDMGSEYRFNGPGSWTYVGKVGGLPLDTVPTQSSTKGITSGGVYTALSAMKAEGYKYMGLATPGSGGTAPVTPNQPVFYIAGPGSYPNFGSITVASGYLGFIKYSGGSWSVESVAVGKDYDEQISTLDGQISQLEAEVDKIVLQPTDNITAGGSWPNFHLNASGLFVADNDAVVYRYDVSAGDLIYLKLAKDTEGVYQFQSAQTAPTSGTNTNLVGPTVTVATDAFVTVPQGATKLYVSRLKTTTTNEVKNAKSYSFEEIYNRESALENRADYMPISANEFTVAAGASHSSSIDQIPVKILSGQEYWIITNGTPFGKFADGTSAQINKTGTAAKDINSIGIYFNNTTANSVRVYAIVLTRGEYLYNFLKANENGSVSEWAKKYGYSKNKAYTILKDFDKNLKLGSLQASLVTSEDTSCVGYCKKIPTNGAKKVTIAPLPLYPGITAYRYRFIQYKDDGTYNTLAATADTSEPYTFTILDGYTSFAIGIYARNGAEAASVNLYNLIDQAINLYYEDAPLSAFAGFEDIPQLINQVIEGQKTYDAIEFNPGVVDKLHQAQRTINRYGDEYLHLPKPLTLLHFSDLHADDTELKRLIAFYGHYSGLIADAICTGDLVYDRWSSDFNFWANTPGAENVLIAIGNHDVLTDPSGYDWSQRATQAQQYERYIAPFVDNWGVTITEGNTYYYKDYDDNEIRLIVLNVMLTGSDDTAQLAWFESVLADAKTNGLNVVVANHYPIANSVVIPSNFTSLDRPITLTDVLPASYIEKVTAFIADEGKFVCYLAGHTHRDYVIKSANQVCIVVDAASVRNGNMSSDTQRTIGEKSQDLANLITFDVSSKVVKIIRVGANMDHYVRDKNCITVNYETGDIITQW